MAFLSPGNRLYHYCSLSTATKYILPYFRLLLSPIQNTNDPRENKSFYFEHYYNVNTCPIGNDLRKVDKELSETIRDGCKVLCFSQDYKEYWGSLLSKMWAHYGDNHRGLCLELDKNKFIQENAANFNFSLFKDIFYFHYDRHNPPKHKRIDHITMKEIGREKYLKGYFRMQHLDHFFFTKNSEWESECEIRLLHFSNKSDNEYCSIKSSLTNIHLGINFDYSHISAIAGLTKGTDIEIIGTDYGDVGLIFETLPKSNYR